MASPPYTILTEANITHFLTHGYIKLPSCFTRAQASNLTASLWTRLNLSPTDKSTWTPERIHMPAHTTFPVASFAPKAWHAICDLLGGPARINPNASTWKDSFIVNLGTAAGEGSVVQPHKLFNWHVDGDFFVHYLDSPEQALLVIPLFSDIAPGGGGTMIAPEGVGMVARHLYANPEGVSPRMTPRAVNPTFSQEVDRERGVDWFNQAARACTRFVEVTGEVGDVYLLHPLMLHSASNNALRVPRVITNPPVGLREPFCFDREDGAYSVVERKTLRELGKGRMEGWGIRGGRERIVPERVRVQERMRGEEAERLRKAGEEK
ncbi:hypothetical protein K432DRAFT_356430 [Lepidopterella palustris CBS 459.81]|uniref:Clavaminate synthase-like protein n=1 Tax=Lepidopterella palustris CBS 459.81 TaxID=1314670 RepID=A0A8E2JDL5_9PEZI|nr:hypothetical protein K432DRAFT_356430 [Lepidopterella palustris CBS 459.81]